MGVKTKLVVGAAVLLVAALSLSLRSFLGRTGDAEGPPASPPAGPSGELGRGGETVVPPPEAARGREGPASGARLPTLVDNLDPAVRRAGRIDKLIYVSAPDQLGRAEILTLHLANRPGADAVDTHRVALDLEGYAASDLRLLVDEAARAAMEANAPISDALLFAATERVPPSITAEDDERYREFTARG